MIPSSHPRAKSLYIREKLVHAFDAGLVAKEGLMAHGRGEAFDYLIGEKTSKSAKKAILAAAFMLKNAKNPVISVNGNIAGLCPREIVLLAKAADAKIEVNLFYATETRRQNIYKTLKKNGAEKIYGMDKKNSTKLSGLDSARRIVDRDGIYSADVVVVPLEDGDRTLALKKAGKKVITFDLNPMSRTAETADITIVDNVVRAIVLLIKSCKNPKKIQFDNSKNLSLAITEIKQNLTKRASHA
ncbi:MAG: phosphopantothenate/pantothenate synthetase [Nitrososphaeria archaeon]|nr:phosphopantothenate/pantothenate synthetase [Nitrososphaeria archaeon]NDB51529.1 phosphopantothenate/pantothenate synthetase [Nitrosopumilaceae archaeon]NDB90063.1 phosphopantothenate/pantothenate synthetase [Nitrososphaerota archaeon]NDB63622.1 phosphopantothenate/pantothenate synthetase [Nitrosopumilaceae archaeon]NDB92066.1 phosphopantothenate/pantothenate synthetase [Nitrososphaeria archaeon]